MLCKVIAEKEQIRLRLLISDEDDLHLHFFSFIKVWWQNAMLFFVFFLIYYNIHTFIHHNTFIRRHSHEAITEPRRIICTFIVITNVQHSIVCNMNKQFCSWTNSRDCLTLILAPSPQLFYMSPILQNVSPRNFWKYHAYPSSTITTAEVFLSLQCTQLCWIGLMDSIDFYAVVIQILPISLVERGWSKCCIDVKTCLIISWWCLF